MTFEEFKATVLKGQEAPADLQKLFELQTARVAHEGEPTDPLEAIYFNLIDPENLPALLSHSYINDSDRANPDTMANIAAFDEVFLYSTFVAMSDDEDPIGYWHGPEGTPISEAPIMMLDSEGQFSLCPGKNISEAMLLHFFGGSQGEENPEFVCLREWFIASGFEIATTSLKNIPEPRASTSHPGDIHFVTYNKFRVAAGLPPSH